MAFTLKNISSTTIAVGSLTLAQGASASVDFVTTAMQTAAAGGYISISPTVATSVVVLTDSSTGTSGGNTVAAITDTATAANAVATLAAKLNALIAVVNSNQALSNTALNHAG